MKPKEKKNNVGNTKYPHSSAACWSMVSSNNLELSLSTPIVEGEYWVHSSFYWRFWAFALLSALLPQHFCWVAIWTLSLSKAWILFFFSHMLQTCGWTLGHCASAWPSFTQALAAVIMALWHPEPFMDSMPPRCPGPAAESGPTPLVHCRLLQKSSLSCASMCF